MQRCYVPSEKKFLFQLHGMSASQRGFVDHPATMIITITKINSCSLIKKHQYLTWFVKAVNRERGFHSIGWRFSPGKTFNRQKLYSFLTGFVSRAHESGFYYRFGCLRIQFNAGDALTEIELDDCFESCIEIITEHLDDEWESQLLACV